VKVRKEEKFLKGKLLVDKQIKKLPHQRHKFSIEYNEFTENNLLNQIFYYTTYISMKKTNWQDNKKLLAKLMLIFEDINLRKISSHDFKRVHFTRLNERFKKSFSLAKIILSTFGAIEGEDAVGFFVDMNDLFEKFICSILSRNLDFEVRYQNKFQIFKKEGLEGIKNMDQKPDYVIYKDDKPLSVLDAKYREINKENGKITISPDILRQIYAYARYYTKKSEMEVNSIGAKRRATKLEEFCSILIFPKSKKYNDFNNKTKIGEGIFFDGSIKLYVLAYNLEGLIEGYRVDIGFLEEVKRIIG
jgi:5-methylcytosine-specific restriction enzyme subunit McrC